MNLLSMALNKLEKAIVIVSDQNEVAFINEACEKLFEIDKKDSVGKDMESLFANQSEGGTIDLNKETSEHIVINGKTYQYTITLLEEDQQKGGKLITFTKVSFHNVMKDINFNTIFNCADDGMILLELNDLEPKVIDVNEKMLEILGYCKEEFLTLRMNDILHQDYHQVAMDTQKKYLETKDPISESIDTVYLNKYNENVYVDVTLTKYEQENKTFVIVNARDKTVQKHYKDMLLESINFNQKLLDSLQMCVSVIENGRMVMSNSRGYEYFYLDPITQNIQGLTVEEWFELLTPNMAEPDVVFPYAIEIIKVGAPVRDWEIKLKDGRYLKVDFIPIRLSGDKTLYVFVGADITDMKQMLDSLARAKREAENATQAKNLFLSQVSHDLRTPLNSIFGFAQLLQMQKEGSLKQNSWINKIYDSAKLLNGLLQDVLDFSVLESGNVKYNNEPLSIIKSMKLACGAVEGIARSKNIVLTNNYPLRDTFVYGDENRLNQILLNLLSNAIKYNKEFGKVSLNVAISRNSVIFHIEDSGIGIEEHNLPFVFQPFYRVNGQTTEEGTGLGLAIVASLVQQLGGTYGIESNIGVGTKVSVTIPIFQCEESKTESQCESVRSN
ncbi:sensor histidine kinase [Bacillus sp. FJAT-45066]|uniref:sensor histidine kinase n=1 Tax=Bacillus sp. FJAT-45066 TaxID=2011010 RepID=UPI000BB77706|nr:PAS domain-containing sensor histidine kinase [Bacillus sp. FJAT-45066]